MHIRIQHVTSTLQDISRKDLLDIPTPLCLGDLVPIRDEQLASQERRNIVDLQLLGPSFQSIDLDRYRWRVLTPLMTVQLNFILDQLTQEEGQQLLVVSGLMDVLPEALQTRSALVFSLEWRLRAHPLKSLLDGHLLSTDK